MLNSRRELELFHHKDYTSFPIVSQRETQNLRNTNSGESNDTVDPTFVESIQSEKLMFDVTRHRGRELWWMFQWVNSSVERAINEIDRDIGIGHGRKVIKERKKIFV